MAGIDLENVSDCSHLHGVQSLEALQGGGLGVAALGLHRSLRALPAESSLVTTHGSSTGCEQPGVCSLRRCFPSKFFWAPGLFQGASDWVGRADVVHCHGFYVGLNLALGGAARRLRKPLIYHPHGFFDPWILARSRLVKKIVGLWFEERNFKSVSCWRALTSKEADQIRAQGFGQRIEIIPNGVDVGAFGAIKTVQPSIERPCRRTLLFLGRLHPKKGLIVLLQVIQKLGKGFDGWELRIVGPDEGGHGGEIDHAIRELNLGDRVRLEGPVVGEDKIKLLKSASGFVLPSLSEGLPMAVLEAAAAGVPLFVTTECNVSEFAVAGAAIEVEPDASALQFGLGEFLAMSEAELAEMGRVARRLVEQHFSWSSIASQVQSLCAELA